MSLVRQKPLVLLPLLTILVSATVQAEELIQVQPATEWAVTNPDPLPGLCPDAGNPLVTGIFDVPTPTGTGIRADAVGSTLSCCGCATAERTFFLTGARRSFGATLSFYYETSATGFYTFTGYEIVYSLNGTPVGSRSYLGSLGPWGAHNCDDTQEVSLSGQTVEYHLEPHLGDVQFDAISIRLNYYGCETTSEQILSQLTLKSCGDGSVDAGESCDDGNLEDGDGCPSTCRIECTDLDRDGYGLPGNLLCPYGGLEDCDDTSCFTYPGAPELLDGADNDCDGLADEDLDDDGDGIPNFSDSCPGTPAGSGVGPDGCAVCVPDPDADSDGFPASVDCDDSDPAVNPDAAEVCNGIDDDCDGAVDEGFDLDDDGFTTCDEPVPDCEDADPAINPDALELPGNSIDENCDGSLGACDPNADWNNHGEYVRCVSHEVEELVASGELTQEEGDALVQSAAQSDVGKR